MIIFIAFIFGVVFYGLAILLSIVIFIVGFAVALLVLLVSPFVGAYRGIRQRRAAREVTARQ